MNKKKIYGPLARFLRAGVRPFLHRWDTSGAQKAQPPAVYVVHHRNMSGPVHTLALLPDEPRPWVLHVFLDRHECFAQYYGYTFRKRFGWPAPAPSAPVSLKKITLEKSSPSVSLKKTGATFGEIVLNLNWSQAEQKRGFFGGGAKNIMTSRCPQLPAR